MIRLIASLFLLSTAAANCTYRYEGKSYEKTNYLSIAGLPTNLVYNPNTKDLLFTLIDIESLQKENEQTRMAQYVFTNGESLKITNIDGQAAAVDVKTNTVYIATAHGLYTLSPNYTGKYFSMDNLDIVQLFKPADKEDLYAVLYPDNDVYKIDVKANTKTRVESVPCAFIMAVDASENIFYECDSKYIKVLLKDFEEPIEFVGISKNAARAVAVDSKDRVILAANDGLYHLKPNNLIPNKLMNLNFVPSGVAFAGDDIFVSTNGNIFKYTNRNCN